MSVRTKIIVTYILIIFLILGLTLYSLEKGKNFLLESAARYSTSLANNVLQKIEYNLRAQIEYIQSYTLDDDLITAISMSNRQFDKMSDRDGYMSRIDEEWQQGTLGKTTSYKHEIFQKTQSKKLVQKFIQFFEINMADKRYAEVFVSNKYGATIFSSNITTDYIQSDESWWQEARKEGVYVSGMAYDESSKQSGLNIAVRIDDKKGNFIGVIKAVVLVQSIIRPTELLLQEYGSTQLKIFSNNNSIVYSSSATVLDRKLSQEPYFASIGSDKDVFLDRSRTGEMMLFCYLKSPGLLGNSKINWSIVVGISRDEILASSNTLQQVVLLVGIIASITVMLIAFHILRTISTPLNLLKNSVNAITKGDLNTQLNYHRHDEFGDLANSFRKMAESLSKSYNKLQAEIETRKETQSKLQKQKDELLKINKELDEFTYVASHDLQEPLRKITAFSNLLKKDLGEDLPENAGKDLSFLTEAADRMKTLVQDLLALSRSGRQELRREPISLKLCVDDALDAVSQRLMEVDSEVTVGPLSGVLGDKTLITQLFQNLFSNSIKFRQNGKLIISVTGEIKEPFVEISVEDNGIGIKAEYQNQIFIPFKRLHGRAAYEGTGIGLSICKKIVERHGGVINVESEEGSGTIFKFTLPLNNK